MELRTAVAGLADPAFRAEAVEAIVAAGDDLIELLLWELLDPDPRVDRVGGIAVLRRFGPVAYRAVTEQLAIAETPDAVELCCQVLDIPVTPDATKYALEILQ